MIIEDLIGVNESPRINLHLGNTIFVNDKHYKLISIKKTLRSFQETILYRYEFEKTDGQKVKDGEKND